MLHLTMEKRIVDFKNLAKTAGQRVLTEHELESMLNQILKELIRFQKEPNRGSV